MVVADLFAGTACVAEMFKSLGARVISNDYLKMSYCIQIQKVKLNQAPFEDDFYHELISEMNSLKGVEGFFYSNYTLEGTLNEEYPRNYFSAENARKIDAIRELINNLEQDGLINQDASFLLKADLIEAVTRISNTAGTYGAFLKKDDPRKYKPLMLTASEFVDNGHLNQCYCENAESLVHKLSGDLLYLDPPYNSRQYPPYYHILETIACGDSPAIYGLTGRRPYSDLMSDFCRKDAAFDALFNMVRNADFSNVLVSYNTEGIIDISQFVDALSNDYCVETFYMDYRRYSSNAETRSEKPLKEVLIYVKK